tara:strand:- start:240 stop:446 length:207 start_codon:yes stop_codon:yes gene_type:complete
LAVAVVVEPHIQMDQKEQMVVILLFILHHLLFTSLEVVVVEEDAMMILQEIQVEMDNQEVVVEELPHT